MSGKYDDMLFLPHHVSAVHPQMSRHDRAAQFSPFAALSGYDAVLREVGRLTQPQKELDEGVQAELNGQLRVLAGLLDQHPEVTVTWFRPDGKKEGGEYLTATGTVRKIDTYREVLILESGEQISIHNLLSLSGSAFDAE